MGRQLTITAVIPAFNAAATIRRAIDSVLAQSDPVEQAIVIDDGSTDGTADIAQEYGGAVRVVQQANAGVSAARNRGVADCRTEWVAFLDADDEWLPEKTAQQRRILRDNPTIRWCFAHMVEIRNGRPAWTSLQPDVVDRLSKRAVMPFFWAAERQVSTGTCGALLDLDLVRSAGGFNPTRRIAEDRDLWWRIAMQQSEIGYASEVGWRYHVDTPDSLTKKSADRSDSLQVVCEHLRWWRRQNRSDFENYGRGLALDYLSRAASGQIQVDSSVTAEAEALLDLSTMERSVLTAMRYLPAAASRRLATRWSGH